MGAHEVPLEYRDRREDYVRLVIEQMIPAGAAARATIQSASRMAYLGSVPGR